jgi:hypothetical protein
LGDGTRVFACSLPAKTFYFLKGGKTLAITRERKAEMLEQYKAWISSSRAPCGSAPNAIDDKPGEVEGLSGLETTMGALLFVSALRVGV